MAAPQPVPQSAGENSNVSLLLTRFSRHLRAIKAPGLIFSYFQHGILPSSFTDQLRLRGLEDTGYFCLGYFRSVFPGEARHINSVLDSMLSQRAPLYLGVDEKAHGRIAVG